MLYRVHPTGTGFELKMLVVIATDWIGGCKSNYHTTWPLSWNTTSFKNSILVNGYFVNGQPDCDDDRRIFVRLLQNMKNVALFEHLLRQQLMSVQRITVLGTSFRITWVVKCKLHTLEMLEYCNWWRGKLSIGKAGFWISVVSLT